MERRYGCSFHATRGDAVCGNDLLVPQRVLETQLLAGLQQKVLHADVISYTLKRFEEALRGTAQQLVPDDDLPRREAQLERQIGNLGRGLADGYSPALTSQLAQLEKELAEVRAKLTAKTPPRIPVAFRDSRRLVERELSNLRILFNEEPRIVRAEIAKHIEKITMTPDGKTKTYVASGTWDLLGFSRGCYDGAGGQNRTGYARLFRAALYQ